jgi:predicted nucleic acid-binding protein
VIFVDTGAFIARHLRTDQYHLQAKKGWGTIARRGWRCVTSNFVLDETFTLLARRASYAFAVERARNILASESWRWFDRRRRTSSGLSSSSGSTAISA